MRLNGIENLAQDFMSNENVCVSQKNLQINEECYIIDITLIDETGYYAYIPCIVAKKEASPKIPNRNYYYFIAKGSKNDAELNTLHDDTIGNYYKYLEDTSPYIFEVKEIIDGPPAYTDF